MTDTLDEREQIDKTKNNQPLTRRQKLLFGMICWGVQSWSQAESFKANGYNQKYIEAKKAMYTGLTIYGIGITLFILLLIFLS
ncbi:MAG: hypothetical protein WBN50_09030 [Lutimonas sp.]